MSPTVFTVLGAQGFIGQALTQWLRNRGYIVNAPARQLSSSDLASGVSGHVIYCIGLTADFRNRLWATVDAHVGVLRSVLADGDFSSLTYLSSTRVYQGVDTGHEEATLRVQPEVPDHLYNLSKLLGESLCHAAYRLERPVRVVRLSNVVGGDIKSDNFICSLLRQAITTGTMELKSSIDSAKDYVALHDVTRMLERISVAGQARCYNLASGRQIRNLDIVEAIKKLTGAEYRVLTNAPQVLFPRIDIGLIKAEFDFSPSDPLDGLVDAFRSFSAQLI